MLISNVHPLLSDNIKTFYFIKILIRQVFLRIKDILYGNHIFVEFRVKASLKTF